MSTPLANAEPLPCGKEKTQQKEAGTCDIVLAYMPYAWLNMPSAALSLLKAEAERGGLTARVVYSNHRFAGRLGYRFFEKFSRLCELFTIGWEILFAPFAGFEPKLCIEDIARAAIFELAAYFEEKNANEDAAALVDEFLGMWEHAQAQAELFLEEETDHILSMQPKIVGCSILTQQRNASFALLRRIKKKAPHVITMLGGGCCIGKAAKQFISAIPEIDYVFTGEGDSVFKDACRLLIAGKRQEMEQRYPCFLRRGAEPVSIVTDDLNKTAVPDHSDYFEQLRQNDFGGEIRPGLLMEASRGCWWGEKGRCRFCGLHYSAESLRYRSKTPERVWEELRILTKRHDCRHVMFTDCILDHKFIRALPNSAPDTPPPWRITAECKSNLLEDDVRRLKQAGFVKLQPGIEALQDDLLKLMHKGNRAIKHIELLKHGRRWGMQLIWNILHTFPGDQAEWYEQTLRLMPLLYHLQPPSAVTPLVLMRCSVFDEEAARFGIFNVQPQLIHDATDPDNEAFTRDTAMLLRSESLKPDMEMIHRLNEGAKVWRQAFRNKAYLGMRKEEERLFIWDTRIPNKALSYALTGARRAVCEAAYNAVHTERLYRLCGDRYSKEEIDEAIGYLTEKLIAVKIGDEVLSLALPRCDPYIFD